MFESFLGMAAALFAVGLLCSWIGGGILPLLVVGAVIWTLFHFASGMSQGGK